MASIAARQRPQATAGFERRARSDRAGSIVSIAKRPLRRLAICPTRRGFFARRTPHARQDPPRPSNQLTPIQTLAGDDSPCRAWLLIEPAGQPSSSASSVCRHRCCMSTGRLLRLAQHLRSHRPPVTTRALAGSSNQGGSRLYCASSIARRPMGDEVANARLVSLGVPDVWQ